MDAPAILTTQSKTMKIVKFSYIVDCSGGTRAPHSTNVAEAGSGKKSITKTVALVTHPDAEQRKNLLAEATAAAAKKLRDEAAAKRTAAAERATEA